MPRRSRSRTSRVAPPSSWAPPMRAAPPPAAHPPAAVLPMAVGSAVSHTVGHAITSGFSGGSSAEPARPDITYQEPQGAQPAYQQQQQQFGPCHYEMKQFLECAQNQGDLKLCEGFSEVLKQCRFANGLALLRPSKGRNGKINSEDQSNLA
ncbi:coiled-coil-helix-coiled-coil-helix domain-containing protein 2-like isoform X2 [Petaurus breviceps papuanus]|uniref:coiled-coil-helix-coiled-coil-helix domain-containing protein 2-like isoform X2 n=1 Tax=Petaurus breviceps papuanus TaxID=3040969 RepID=UPI0036DCC978